MPAGWCGITDIKDCFHNTLILGFFFSLILVTAKEIGIEGSTLLQNGCKVVLESETLVSLAWSVLPKGCSWSLYFAQSVTEAIASRAPAMNGLSHLHDKAKDLVLGRHEGAQEYYVCVGNLGVIAKTQQEADTVLEQWKNPFTGNGLSFHKSELSHKVKSLGVELDGLSLCCHVSSKRFWTLRRAWMRFFGEERSLDVPLKLLLVTPLSCFSVLELRCVHCTRVIVHARTLSRCDSPLNRNSGRTGCGSSSFDFLIE